MSDSIGDNASIVRLNNLSYSVQTNHIIRQISLDIAEGKTTALIGPSGSGKSSLLKLCAGLIIPTKGEVYYRGKDIAAMKRLQALEFRRESAFVFQDSALWANQSLLQNLMLPLRIHFPQMPPAMRRQRIDEVVATVGYKRGLAIRPESLSMGEQKLIAFARALLCNPTLLYLDEWTESLDDHSAQRLVALVKQQKLRNNTIIFVGHNLEIIQELADYVVMVVAGQIHTIIDVQQLSGGQTLSQLLGRSFLE